MTNRSEEQHSGDETDTDSDTKVEQEETPQDILDEACEMKKRIKISIKTTNRNTAKLPKYES